VLALPHSWYEPYEEGTDQKEPAKVEIMFKKEGEKEPVLVQFDTLCETCAKSVAGYLENIMKPMKHKSPTRTKKDEG